MLCEVCSQIVQDGSFEELTKNIELVYFREEWRVLTNVWKAHHDDVEALQRAAVGDCYVCSRVSKEVKEITGPLSYQINVRTRTPLEPEQLDDESVSVRGAFGLSIRLAPPHAEGRNGFTVVDFDLDDFEDDRYALDLSERSLDSNSTGSSACLELARHWLKKCLDRHKGCGQSRDPAWYPTRLLHIDPNSDVARLVETASHRPTGPYATLSHSWGAHPIVVLTPANIADTIAVGRPIEDFPRSFRDCLRTISTFGFAYVWIDSFCILQGSSPESVRDWERESLRMEHVYANSVLNIASSFAQDSRGGCFQERTSIPGSPHRFDWRPINGSDSLSRPEGDQTMMKWVFDARLGMDRSLPLVANLSDLHQKRTFVLSEYGNSSNVLDQFGRHHLFSRGWVAQEQLLPPRMLHFGQDQLWWQCHDVALLSETFPCQRTCRIVADGSNPATAIRPGVLDTSTAGLLDFWSRIVAAYTRRALTKPEQDKLRAIQGIADRISKLSSEEYLCGVFRQQLPRALCWARMQGDAGRTQPLRAPSWSWASMDDGISLMLSYDPKRSTQLDPHPQALLAAMVAPIRLAEDITDRVEGPGLALLGRLLPMARNGGDELEFDGRLLTLENSNALIKFELDDSANTRPDLLHNLYFLPIYERGRPSEPVGILLVDNLDETFSRIGVTKRYKPSQQPDIMMQAYQEAKTRLLFLV